MTPPGSADLAADLSAPVVAEALGGRAVQSYPALLSTEATALAWARAGAPAGAVVVADYQASPRGRGGLPWQVSPGRGLGCSVVLRPALPAEREGWLYLAASCALAATAREPVTTAWPDQVWRDDVLVASLTVHAHVDGDAVPWAVLTVLATEPRPPRAAALATLVEAVERWCAAPAAEVLADYRGRCATLGADVLARLVPLGPTGTTVTGTAVDCRDDGSLVIAEPSGRRVAVRPQALGHLELLEPVELLDQRPPQAPVEVVHALARLPHGDAQPQVVAEGEGAPVPPLPVEEP